MRFISTALLGAFVATQYALAQSPANDLIQTLPGINFAPNFKQYAGYITVDEAHGRKLFYWLVESQRDPANDDVLLWQNGGPGCSSLGGGLMSELGPFYPNATADGLDSNPYAWNTISTNIFIDSPAGVGFSYSDTQSDYTVGDLRTAQDLHVALVKIFQAYPQIAKNKFWLAGESYGGHYVPNLAKYIVDANKQPGAFQINLQGFLVGNAWTDAPVDNYGAAFDWYTHGLVSESTFNGVVTQCNLSEVGPLSVTLSEEARHAVAAANLSCNDYQNLAFAEMGNIDIYDIYVDVCTESRGQVKNQARQLLEALGRVPSSSSSSSGGHAPAALKAGSDTPSGGDANYNPCIDSAVQTYLNRQDTKYAIHATQTPFAWTLCSSFLNYSRKDLLTSMLPVYRDLFEAGIKIMVFSGDVDAIVPITGTRAWLKLLDLDVVEPWRPYTVDGQVGGYVTVYKQMQFVTVRNAGHMVPQTQRSRALHMFTNFINDKPM